MLESEKLAIAAHLHVVMRRKIGRVTDVEWLLRSPEYAREIIRVAQAEPQHADVLEWADKLSAALFPASADKASRPVVASAPLPDASDSRSPGDFSDSRLKGQPGKPPAPRYVGSLR